MNTEKLKGGLEKVKTALGKISKKIWILLATVIIVLAVGIAIFLNTRPYATLIAGASADEAGAVVTWLTEQGISDYRLEGTGTILVPESQAANLKARLLMEQYSGSSSSYSGYFERVSALSSESMRENAWKITLIEVMEETIRRFDGVRDVTVTIDLGEDRRYILDSNNVVKATAGVMLTMENGKLLSTEQANAIRNYIAHSVAGLDVSSVSIGDTWGNTYDSFTSVGGEASSALKLQLEQQWSNIIRNHIMQVLAPIYGEKNVAVTVNVVVEVGDTTITDYQVHLPEEAQWSASGGAGIIGSRVGSYMVLTGEEIIAGGLVGTSSNSNLPIDVEQDPTKNDYDGKIDGSYEIIYDNPKTEKYTVMTAGYIRDCTVSVGINTTTAGALSGADIEEIRGFVSTASGITAVTTENMTAQEYLASKISVLARPFYVEPGTEPGGPDDNPGGVIPSMYLWIIVALGAGILLFVIVLTVILLLRKKKRKKKAEEQKAVEELIAVAMPEPPEQQQVDEHGNPVTGADVMDLHTERSMELRQSIRDFVDENMEVAALLVRGWLKGDEDSA